MNKKPIFTALLVCVTLFAPLALRGQGLDLQMERRNNFINKGFGFEYSYDEIEDMDLFIARHGKPLQIIEEYAEHLGEEVRDKWGVIKNKIITLEYDTVMVCFKKYRSWGNNSYKTLLISILSKNNRVYMYGIRQGLTMKELENIIGKVEFWRVDEPKVVLEINDNRAVILFDEDKIAQIVWYNNVQ